MRGGQKGSRAWLKSFLYMYSSMTSAGLPSESYSPLRTLVSSEHWELVFLQAALNLCYPEYGFMSAALNNRFQGGFFWFQSSCTRVRSRKTQYEISIWKEHFSASKWFYKSKEIWKKARKKSWNMKCLDGRSISSISYVVNVQKYRGRRGWLWTLIPKATVNSEFPLLYHYIHPPGLRYPIFQAPGNCF